MALGQYIRKRREEKDLSLREFAKKLNCSAAFVSDIELGRRYPSENVLRGIAKLLETSVDDLRSYDTRPPTEEIKRLAEQDPRYALAFRKLVDKKIRPEDLLKWAEKELGHKNKK